jgi:hypothetical protein
MIIIELRITAREDRKNRILMIQTGGWYVGVYG